MDLESYQSWSARTGAVVEQAAGVLVERHGWEPGYARQQLVITAQRTDTPTHELADLIVQAAARSERGPALGDEAWAYRLLDVMLNPAMRLLPVRDERGTVVDFHIAYANPATRDPQDRTAAQIVGNRFLWLYPESKAAGLIGACEEVLASGRAYTVQSRLWTGEAPGAEQSEPTRLRVAPFADGLLLTWETSSP